MKGTPVSDDQTLPEQDRDGRHSYATFNELADMREGQEGSPKGWRIRRFSKKATRDAFVAENGHRRARAITRQQADLIWRDTFLCRGEPPPVGGLFYQRRQFEE